jgi:hypothetical protein
MERVRAGRGEVCILVKRRPSKRRGGGEASGVEGVKVFVNIAHTGKVSITRRRERAVTSSVA